MLAGELRVSFANICEKIDRVIRAPHCISLRWLEYQQIFYNMQTMWTYLTGGSTNIILCIWSFQSRTCLPQADINDGDKYWHPAVSISGGREARASTWKCSEKKQSINPDHFYRKFHTAMLSIVTLSLYYWSASEALIQSFHFLSTHVYMISCP